MTFTIVYIFVAVATFIAVKSPNDYTVSDLIASLITGAIWPLTFTVRIITKIFS